MKSGGLIQCSSHYSVFCFKQILRLDVYVHDYLKKRNMNETAAHFARESSVDQDGRVPIDICHGFLYEWWTVFWDFYNARASKPTSNEAISFLNTMKQVYV